MDNDKAIFKSLPEATREKLLRAMKKHILEPGDVLFEQGSPGDSLVLVEAGELAIHATKGPGKPKLVARLGPNSVVGEMSCLDPAPRSATVVASKRTVIRKLNRNSLTALRARRPKIGVAVVQSIIEQINVRIRSTDQLIQENLEALGRKRGQPPTETQSSPPVIRATSPTPFRGDIDLSKISTLKKLSPADLQILSVAAPAKLFTAKSVLCVEGDRAASCYMLISGKIDVLRRAQHSYRRLATLASGALVGQLALVDTAPRTATLQAQTDVVVLEFARDDFKRLLDAESPLAIRFQEEVAVAGIRQLRKATQALASLPSLVRPDVRPEPPQRSSPGDGNPGPSVEKYPDNEEIQDTLTYMQTALKEWGMSLKDLDKIHVKKLPGQLSAAEIKARNKV
jgi:CRP-like cAMP-binding protein